MARQQQLIRIDFENAPDHEVLKAKLDEYQQRISECDVLILSDYGEGARWQLDGEPQLHEAHYLKLYCSKAKARLDWYPRWNLSTTLAALIHWHKKMLSGDNMKSVSLQQIADFQSHIHLGGICSDGYTAAKTPAL